MEKCQKKSFRVQDTGAYPPKEDSGFRVQGKKLKGQSTIFCSLNIHNLNSTIEILYLQS